MKSFSSIVVVMAMLAQTQGAALRKLQEDSLLSDDDISEMLYRINRFRTENGLSELSMDKRVMGAAQDYANEMASNCHFDHYGVDGSDVSQRLQQWGVDGAMAENIAAGQLSVDEVMDSWIESDGHRDNLLGDFTNVGFGRQDNGNCGDYSSYWVQNFST